MEKSLQGLTILLLIFLAVSGCKTEAPAEKTDPLEQKVRAKAQAYFITFSERSDWETFCDFYAEDVAFRDVILQIELDSLWKFKRFYKWDEEGNRFAKLTPDQEHLKLESLVVDGKTAVAKGRVNPFYYDGYLIDTEWGMDFTIWLKFDDSLKIIEQQDWFEYSPEILENMIERCRENGFEAIPEWLDLSKPD